MDSARFVKQRHWEKNEFRTKKNAKQWLFMMTFYMTQILNQNSSKELCLHRHPQLYGALLANLILINKKETYSQFDIYISWTFHFPYKECCSWTTWSCHWSCHNRVHEFWRITVTLNYLFNTKNIKLAPNAKNYLTPWLALVLTIPRETFWHFKNLFHEYFRVIF